MATKKLIATASGTGTLMLPQFAPGMLLQHDDLAALGAFSQNLSRLMLRALVGCGVICGLTVRAEMKCCKLVITIDTGIALDACGDPIQVPAPQQITIDPECDPNFPDLLYVVLCAKTRQCAPRPAMCASDGDDDVPVYTRQKYGFEIRIVTERPDCVCGCPEPPNAREEALLDTDCRCANPQHPCYVDHYSGNCGCNCCDGTADGTCDCGCVLLARLQAKGDPNARTWNADHRVRRFVRPVLIEDPQVRIENDARKKQADAHAATPAPATPDA